MLLRRTDNEVVENTKNVIRDDDNIIYVIYKYIKLNKCASYQMNNNNY